MVSASLRRADTRGDQSHRSWRLRAWDDPDLQRLWISRSIIAISGDEIGDVTDNPTSEKLRSRLRAAPKLATRSERAFGIFVGYWTTFRSTMQVGDLVVVPLTGRRAAIGEVTGPYEYRKAEPEPKLRHVRSVRWLATNIERRNLPADLLKTVNAPGTLFGFSAPHATRRLREMAG